MQNLNEKQSIDKITTKRTKRKLNEENLEQSNTLQSPICLIQNDINQNQNVHIQIHDHTCNKHR